MMKPAVNPDSDDIADRAKHAYATGTKALAAIQYRLAELGGTGQLDADECLKLQWQIVSIWEALYYGTVCAVRDLNTDDCTWDEADNTYSNGREVMIQTTIEPREIALGAWAHIKFSVGDGAVNAYPRGTVSYIAPIESWGDQGNPDLPDGPVPF